MPDRVIRDELLTSERYWSVGVEAQQLFIHLLLCADSLGRYTGKNFSIRMACYPGHARNPDVIEKLLSDLNDADLIRMYTVGDERFIFIPRYRQRLRYTNSKYPPPPKEINDISEQKTDSSLTTVRPAPLEVKRSEEVPLPNAVASGHKKRVRSPKSEAKSAQVWNAYSTAYFNRYKVEPVRNAQVNSLLSRFVDRLGADAPAVASYYLTHDRAFYVASKHAVNVMLSNAEGLRTDWATAQHTTETVARNADKGQSQKTVWNKLRAELPGQSQD